MWDETLASTYVEPSDKTNNSRDGGELRILDVEVLHFLTAGEKSEVTECINSMSAHCKGQSGEIMSWI